MSLLSEEFLTKEQYDSALIVAGIKPVIYNDRL